MEPIISNSCWSSDEDCNNVRDGAQVNCTGPSGQNHYALSLQNNLVPNSLSTEAAVAVRQYLQSCCAPWKPLRTMKSSADGAICLVNSAASGQCRTRLETDVPNVPKTETVKSTAVGGENSNTFHYCYPNQTHSRPLSANLHKTWKNLPEGDRTPTKCSVREFGIQCDLRGDKRDWQKRFLVNKSTQTTPKSVVGVSAETVTCVDQFFQMGLQSSEISPLERSGKKIRLSPGFITNERFSDRPHAFSMYCHKKEMNCSKSPLQLEKETISDSSTVTDMDNRSVFCVKDVCCEGYASSTESNLRSLVDQKDQKLPLVRADKLAQIGDLDLHELPQKIACAQMCWEKKEYRNDIQEVSEAEPLNIIQNQTAGQMTSTHTIDTNPTSKRSFRRFSFKRPSRDLPYGSSIFSSFDDKFPIPDVIREKQVVPKHSKTSIPEECSEFTLEARKELSLEEIVSVKNRKADGAWGNSEERQEMKSLGQEEGKSAD